MGKKKKRLWAVYGSIVGSKYLGEFEAETKEAAIQQALNSAEASISLCHECSHEISDPTVDEEHTTAESLDESIEDEGG